MYGRHSGCFCVARLAAHISGVHRGFWWVDRQNPVSVPETGLWELYCDQTSVSALRTEERELLPVFRIHSQAVNAAKIWLTSIPQR